MITQTENDKNEENNYLFSSVIWAHKFSIVKYYSAWLAKQMEIPY